MRTLLALLLCALLGACASPPQAPPDSLWRDARFAPPSERPDAAAVFAIDDAMRDYLRHELSGEQRRRGPQHALMAALQKTGQLRLEYEAEHTRNAREAFGSRAGNCLSLAIMTAALAQELGLRVDFQQVLVDDYWTRAGELRLGSMHVNITLEPRLAGRTVSEDTSLTVDFLPPELLRRQRTRSISRSTVLAMYMNNRAAESLVRKEVDDAYWWAREATRQEPGFVSAYNTLAVVYTWRGMTGEAHAALSRALAIDPDHKVALGNMVGVLQRLGRDEEAQAVATRLARIEPYPPFHYFDQGLAAMSRGDYRVAREMFAREVARAGYYHEFHYWLALAEWRLGNVEVARSELSEAMAASGTRGDRERYAAKLAWLRAQ